MSHVQAIMNHLEDLGSDRPVVVVIQTSDGYTRTYDVLATSVPSDGPEGFVVLGVRERLVEPTAGPPAPEPPQTGVSTPGGAA